MLFPSRVSTTIEQLKSNKAVTVTEGSGWTPSCCVVSSYEGALASVDARQALSKAVDRQAYMGHFTYQGSGHRASALFVAPGTWGYAADTFAAAHKALPVMNQDLAEAKKLAEKAGVVGKNAITIGVATEIESQLAQANAYKTAAEAIGMKLEFKTVSADEFINFFIDPEFRKGMDRFPDRELRRLRRPDGVPSTIVSDKGSQNFGDYKTESVRKLMEEARSTSDPKARAEKVLEAQKMVDGRTALDPHDVSIDPVDHQLENGRYDSHVLLHVLALGQRPRRRVEITIIVRFAILRLLLQTDWHSLGVELRHLFISCINPGKSSGCAFRWADPSA